MERNAKLFRACQAGDLKRVVSLITGSLFRKGLPVDSRDENLDTPLIVAACCGHKDIVDYLLTKGADVNRQDGLGRSALHGALRYGKDDVALRLLDAGADVSLRQNDNQSVLDSALSGKCSAAVARRLLDKGAKDCSPDALIASIEGGWIDIARSIIESGADLRLGPSDGRSFVTCYLSLTGYKDDWPDHYKARVLDFLELLLKHHADINQADEYGDTPLIFARRLGSKEIEKILLEHGATDGPAHRPYTKKREELIALIDRYLRSPSTFNRFSGLYDVERAIRRLAGVYEQDITLRLIACCGLEKTKDEAYEAIRKSWFPGLLECIASILRDGCGSANEWIMKTEALQSWCIRFLSRFEPDKKRAASIIVDILDAAPPWLQKQVVTEMGHIDPRWEQCIRQEGQSIGSVTILWDKIAAFCEHPSILAILRKQCRGINHADEVHEQMFNVLKGKGGSTFLMELATKEGVSTSEIAGIPFIKKLDGGSCAESRVMLLDVCDERTVSSYETVRRDVGSMGMAFEEVELYQGSHTLHENHEYFVSSGDYRVAISRALFEWFRDFFPYKMVPRGSVHST
jgi:ankyrin repeat protein